MSKPIDQLFHFTGKLSNLKDIFKDGFKPSYASETLADKKIKVAMISLSNVLLRDVGQEEVIHYGGYGLALTREWGIANQFNPVIYTYDEGLLQQAIKSMIENSVFLGFIEKYRAKIKEMSDCKCGPFSKHIDLSNTSKESMAIVDYLSTKYDDDLIEIVSAHSRMNHETNLTNIKLAKPYKVKNAKGDEFIAYNDREWRKVYSDLPILFEGEDGYTKWEDEKKPHFNEGPNLVGFNITDIKAILVVQEEEIQEMIKFLEGSYGADALQKLLGTGQLHIGTKKMLEKNNF